MCNFGTGYYEEQFCEIILKDQWLWRKCCEDKEISFKDNSIFGSGGHVNCSAGLNILINFDRRASCLKISLI